VGVAPSPAHPLAPCAARHTQVDEGLLSVLHAHLLPRIPSLNPLSTVSVCVALARLGSSRCARLGVLLECAWAAAGACGWVCCLSAPGHQLVRVSGCLHTVSAPGQRLVHVAAVQDWAFIQLSTHGAAPLLG